MSNGKVVKVSGPLVVATGLAEANMADVVRVGEQRLIGEVLTMTGDAASIQVYEETSGLVYGDNVFEKDGIRRDRTGDGEKTRCLCGKRGIFNRDGPAMGPQIIRQLE